MMLIGLQISKLSRSAKGFGRVPTLSVFAVKTAFLLICQLPPEEPVFGFKA
jgi:hypothetical protein